MSQTTLGVGIIGVSPARGWAAIAHIPALRALPNYEIRALSAHSAESARAAGEAFGVGAVFSDHGQLLTQPDIDVVAVTVKVPHHRELVSAALAAGKAVYCEWPLGRDVDDARAMAALAAGHGARTAVGLQARQAPAIGFVQELLRDGYVGEVLSTTMVGLSVPGGVGTGEGPLMRQGEPLSTAGGWPRLRVDDWSQTRDTVHMWTQIVGKIRMAHAPMLNHWWQVTLYVTPRGLTTSKIPYGRGAFDIEFDFCDHRLHLRTSNGAAGSVVLRAKSVAEFHAEDDQHASYDPGAIRLFWHQLIQADRVLNEFRSYFRGKVVRSTSSGGPWTWRTHGSPAAARPLTPEGSPTAPTG